MSGMNHTPFSRTRTIDRILVVDDTLDNCLLIQAILQDEGYQVELADSGKEALRIIEQSPPDLILLDVMMPEMDGYEVTRRIRANAALPFIPILLTTAYDQPSVAQGLDTGADDFIRKPVHFDELLARVRALLRLKHSVDERDQIARQREDFVSRLTHDLRTPLVAADRMLNLMAQGALGDLSDDVQDAIATMIRSNSNLLTMVNTLLEVYRYEAGRKTLIFSPVNLLELAQEVIQELSPLAIDKQLALKLEAEASEEYIAKGDRLELYRVLTNLIGNAIKFTDEGSVTVRLIKVDTGLVPAIKIEVQDTGAGISDSDRATLFESFIPGKHKKSGSGLGLHLTRRIVEAHNGRINVMTEPDQGSTFTVYLPTH
ncbi:MAG: hybrid sensor histidine kinase/response regulator [Leptolyngbya sp. UWPOB_LEPTO1]|nr:hybrid sensor histidine kinase/response regulator [Leptolyngbya sp. UWPOB_LEPTO1]MBN8563881.1 hybrid sensor histidine kinase/response regulator [Leptolyngbya sp. UWPOB_LEPTO1]